jgi:glycosyltransferase involved in cell wall biosynthesis
MISDLETLGGAAIAASRLAEGLLSQGAQVTRLVARRDRSAPPWRAIAWSDLFDESAAEVASSETGCVAEDDALAGLAELLERLQPDVVNLHNLHLGPWSAWTPRLIDICCRAAPTIWTLHDMWSFTGRCAYAYDCSRFVSGCDESCPTPEEYPALSPPLIAPAWRERREMFQRNPQLVAVTPSRWLAGEAARGLWAGHHVERIPYGLPLDQFVVRDRSSARERLGLPPKGPVLLAIAEDLAERRKGGGLLQRALQSDSLPALNLLTVGEGEPADLPDRIRLRRLGYVVDLEALVDAYNAADLLLHAAPVDNFPNVVLEALACGTPTVAFPVGGIPELVRPGLTGWLAEEVGPKPLALAAASALDKIANGENLRDPCRSIAESEYASELQAERYLELLTRSRSTQ